MFFKKTIKESTRKLRENFDVVTDDGEIKFVPKNPPKFSDSPRNIGLNDNEQAAYDAFYQKHKHGAIKLVMINNSGIGYDAEVSCGHCKKTKDITDFSSW